MRTSWDDQVEMIHDGRVDVSIVRPPVPRRGLTVVPLFTEPRLVVLPLGHPLSEQLAPTIADLAKLDLIQDPDAVPEWRDAVEKLRPAALSTDRFQLPVVGTVEEKLEQVALGRGIVVLPRSTALFYTRPDVVHRRVADLADGEVALAFDTRRASAEMEAIVEIAQLLGDTSEVSISTG